MQKKKQSERQIVKRQREEVVFIDEIPPKRGGGTSWSHILLPLTKRGGIGRPALVKVCDTPQQAIDAQGNLRKRNVKIPFPDGNWEFYSRGCDVYAIFKGRVPPKAVRTKTKRGGSSSGSVRRAR